MNKYRHIAVIPARKGSKGIPGKNRLLFQRTLDFITSLDFIDEVIVSSNDEAIIDLANGLNLRMRRRPDAISDDAAPIKPTFVDLVDSLAIDKNAYLWLFYIPFVFRDAVDFKNAHALIESLGPSSVSTFVPALTHPYRCWGQDPKTGKMFKFIDNDKVGRQDFPAAWANHHYIYCIRAGALDLVNSNLLGPDTTPIYFSEAQASRLIEIDDPNDLAHWAALYPDDYETWRQSLPPGALVLP